MYTVSVKLRNMNFIVIYQYIDIMMIADIMQHLLTCTRMTVHCCFFFCGLQALEEEFARKLQEQEMFFKMSGESECLNPSAQSRISKFYPIPSVQSTGF